MILFDGGDDFRGIAIAQVTIKRCDRCRLSASRSHNNDATER